MSRTVKTIITVLCLIFLPALVVENGTTKEHGGGKAQMKKMKGMEGMKGMKGMKDMGMKDAPVVPCMLAMVKSASKRPKGSKKGKIVILKDLPPTFGGRPPAPRERPDPASARRVTKVTSSP